MTTVRCTWDSKARALYVYFDGSKVADEARLERVTIETMGNAVVDIGVKDDVVKGVEVLSTPVAPRDVSGGFPMTPWHWVIVGRAWEQAQSFKDDGFYDWLMDAGGEA